MKKYIITLLLTITACFILTGCGNSSSNPLTKSKSNTYKFKNVSFVFDQDSEFNNFKFKNSKELTKDESKYSLHLEYVNKDVYDGRFVYRLALSYTDDSNLEKFFEGHERKKVKINGITWDKTVLDSKVDNKPTKAVVYATEKDSVLYSVSSITFVESGVDIEKLAEVFINGVTLK
jgi:hypothetical protein